MRSATVHVVMVMMMVLCLIVQCTICVAKVPVVPGEPGVKPSDKAGVRPSDEPAAIVEKWKPELLPATDDSTQDETDIPAVAPLAEHIKDILLKLVGFDRPNCGTRCCYRSSNNGCACLDSYPAGSICNVAGGWVQVPGCVGSPACHTY